MNYNKSTKLKYRILGVTIALFMYLIFYCLHNLDNIYIYYLGDVKSLYEKAEMCYKEKDYVKARKLYTKLARIDSASRCQYIIGDMFYQGKGGKINYKNARKYFLKAAQGGNADAQNNLGYIYVHGKGVDIDYNEAKKWLRMAAAQGHTQALVGLGGLYRNGWGVIKSLKEAFKLYRRAAARGNTDAMNNLYL